MPLPETPSSPAHNKQRGRSEEAEAEGRGEQTQKALAVQFEGTSIAQRDVEMEAPTAGTTAEIGRPSRAGGAGGAVCPGGERAGRADARGISYCTLLVLARTPSS